MVFCQWVINHMLRSRKNFAKHLKGSHLRDLHYIFHNRFSKTSIPFLFSLNCGLLLLEWGAPVRVSSVALRHGSEMDPYQRDLTNILHSYLVSDSFGPVLGARAWSCKTTNDYLGLSRLRNTSEIFGERCLRLPPGLLMFYITFLLYGLLGLTILDHIYSSFL